MGSVKRNPSEESVVSDNKYLSLEEIIPHLRGQVQRHCDKVGGKPFMLIFRRPRRKWELLALQIMKEFEAQLADQKMMSDFQWIAQWRNLDDANVSVHREYDRCYRELLRLSSQITEDLDWMTRKKNVVQKKQTAERRESLKSGGAGLKSTTAELRAVLAPAAAN